MLEELAKERGIGEVQILGNLPYWLVAVSQLKFSLLNNVAMNPLHDSLAAGLADDSAKIIGSQAETVGIEGDGMLASGMFVD